MRKLLHVAVMSVLAGLSVAAFGAEAEMPMAEPVEYANAGISIALPKGFAMAPLTDSFQLFQAVKREGKETTQAVSLSAFPVAEEVTPQAFGDAMIADMKKDLAVRGLEVGKLVTLKVAGLPAAARRMTYRSSGVPAVAVGTCFIREGKGPEPRMAYVLMVQSSPKQEELLLPTFAAVTRSIAMTGLRHPADLRVEKLAAPYADYRLGFSIRPPVGWYAAAMPKGVEIARTDYLLGGLPMPKLRVIVDELTREESAEKICARAMASVQASAEEHRLNCETVEQEKTSLGGVEGYRFVLRQTVKGEKSGDVRPTLLLQRVICVPDARGASRQYTVVMLTQGRADRSAVRMMDTICESFRLLKAVETKPTTATAPAANGEK